MSERHQDEDEEEVKDPVPVQEEDKYKKLMRELQETR
jgi:hypothetical protein